MTRTHEIPHDAVRDLTGAYALGMLSGEDRRAVEDHLSSCSECADEIRSFARVLEGLGHAVEPRVPPASLRDRVRARVRAEAGDPGSRPVRAAPALRRPAWMALAAALALVAVGIYAVGLRGRISTLERQLAEAEARASAAERNVRTLHVRAALGERASEILAAPDVTRVDLMAEAPAAGATARAFLSPSRGLVFAAANLPALPPGREYQLWIVTADGRPISAGTFSPESSGDAAVATAPLEAPRPAAVAVTLEPAGGVPAPTGPRYLIGTL